jgi:sugar O-acyltransferase (sialic acid O-acetyltransferase NeuD family)
VIIIGTGGHALDLLSDGFVFRHYDPLYFFDNVNTHDPPVVFEKYKILKLDDEINNLPSTAKKFIIAVGSPNARRLLCLKMEALGVIPVSYISPLALVAPTASIGVGSNIMPFASIFGRTTVGKGTLVNSYASIHHDVEVGTFCEISPGARVLGRVRIGEGVQLGANAMVLPGVNVGNFSIIGAGAVVTTDLPDNCTAVGVPAKIIKYNNAL